MTNKVVRRGLCALPPNDILSITTALERLSGTADVIPRGRPRGLKPTARWIGLNLALPYYDGLEDVLLVRSSGANRSPTSHASALHNRHSLPHVIHMMTPPNVDGAQISQDNSGIWPVWHRWISDLLPADRSPFVHGNAPDLSTKNTTRRMLAGQMASTVRLNGWFVWVETAVAIR